MGNAEAAVTTLSGISKQEGVKNVFVRGLGDRYNVTTLNGFPVPSEDPEYKNISLAFSVKMSFKTSKLARCLEEAVMEMWEVQLSIYRPKSRLSMLHLLWMFPEGLTQKPSDPIC